MDKFKLICCVTSLLFGILPCTNTMQPEQRIDRLRRDLDENFKQSNSDNMFVITVTRTPSLQFSTPLISDDEFRQVLRLLYATCAHPGLVTGRHGINFPYYKHENAILGMGKPITGTMVNNVNSLIFDIEKYFTEQHMKDAHKLVVFNEMFFSQEVPLNIGQKNFIENQLLELSKSSRYGVFYPNFLYTEVKQKKGRDVYTDLLNMGKRAGNNGLNAVREEVQRSISKWGRKERAEPASMSFERGFEPLKEGAKRIVHTIPNDESLVAQEYLFNETYAIYDGTLLTRTAKFGYWRESDSKISQGCIYMSGPGYTEGLATNSQQAIQQNVLLKDISVDICVDLNIRENLRRRVSDFSAVGTDSCLHIVQSNSIDPFHNDINRNNLPTMRGIIHADPHCKFLGACFPYVEEDRSLGKIFCSKREFPIDFWESNYTINILKI